jgi:hypothetical protein
VAGKAEDGLTETFTEVWHTAFLHFQVQIQQLQPLLLLLLLLCCLLMLHNPRLFTFKR